MPRESSPMLRKPLTLVPAFLILLLGCSTIQTTQGQRTAIKAVPCTEIPTIRYHAPLDAASIKLWLEGALLDPSNGYDTTDTVAQVRRNNAARKAVCGP